MSQLSAKEIIQKFGGIRPMAKRLNLTPSTVQGWHKRDAIPDSRYRMIIEAADEDGINIFPKAQGEAKSVTKATIAPQAEAANDGDRRQRSDRRERNDRRKWQDPNYRGTERRTGLERRMKQDRREKRSTIRAEKWKFVERSMVTIAFIFILISIPAIVMMAPEFITMQKKAERLDQMEERLKLMDQRMQKINETSGGGSLGGHINAGVSQVRNMVDTAKVQERIAGLEKDFNDLTSRLGNVVGMMDKVGNLQNTPEGQAKVLQSMMELRKIVNGLQGDMGSLNQAVEQAREGDTALATIMQDVNGQDVGAAAMMLALGQFRDMVGRNETPFEEDLAMMQSMIGPEHPELQASLDKLTPHAKDGLLSKQRLNEEFKGLASDIIMAQLEGEDLSVKERAMTRLNNLVRIRKRGEISGDSTEAVVARAQHLLEQGDVKGAMAELEKLDGASKDAAQGWMDQANGRVTADTVAKEISQKILADMTSKKKGSMSNIKSFLNDAYHEAEKQMGELPDMPDVSKGSNKRGNMSPIFPALP